MKKYIVKKDNKLYLKLPIILILVSLIFIIPTVSIYSIGQYMLKNDAEYQECLDDLFVKRNFDNKRIRVASSKFYYCEKPKNYRQLPFYEMRHGFSTKSLLFTFIVVFVFTPISVVVFISGIVILILRMKKLIYKPKI